MRRLLQTCAFAVLLSFLVSPCNAQDKIEIFGGYSFMRSPVTFTETGPSCPGPLCVPVAETPHLNLNGWEFGGAYKVLGPLALAGDFSGTYGSFRGASTHLQTYLFGPQLRFPGPISPFAHVLIGGAHEAIGTSTAPGIVVSGPTQTSFATALGVGIDLKVLPFISVRPIQFDYIVTRFNSGTQNQPRISAGIVLHF